MCLRGFLAAGLVVAASALPAADPDARFVAVGAGGRRITSHDGVTWENDQRWSDVAADDDDVLCNIAFGAGRFVAVGGGAKLGRIVTTINGREWRKLPAFPGRVATIVFARDRFIATHEGELLSSLDGLTFTPGEKLAWSGSIHARRSACGDTEAGFRTVVIGDLDLSTEKRRVSWRAATSDGSRWESRALDTPPAADIAYGSGHFVVVGPDGLIESSHDGETWQRHDTTGNEPFSRIVWTGSRFLISGGKVAWSSADGFTWKAEAAPIPCALAFAQENEIAIGFTPRGEIFTSANLLTWKQPPLPPGPPLEAIAVRSSAP